MKACQKNRKLIAWMVLDELREGEASKLRTHFEHCRGCRDYHAQMLSVTQRLQTLAPLATEEAESELLTHSGHSAYFPYVARHSRSEPASFIGASPWRLILPAMAVVLLALFVVVTLERQMLFTNQSWLPTPAPRETASTRDVLPTLANYRALANNSLERLDAVLSQQSRQPVAPTMTPNSGTLALLNIPD